MDIYKLSEEIPDGEKDEGVEFEITDLKQGVKNPDRVNVYVNGKFSFSLDVSQVVDLGVKKGLVISCEKLEEFKKASEFGKLYQRALEWVLSRPHSEKEVRDYLYRKLRQSSSDALAPARRPGRRCACTLPVGRAWSSEDISEFSTTIIQRLKSKGYVDDRRFAEWYVENRFLKKGISAKRLKMELMKKGISADVVSEVLSGSERNEKEEILKVVAKKRSKYDTDEKLIQYLLRQGFSYALVREVVESSSILADE